VSEVIGDNPRIPVSSSKPDYDVISKNPRVVAVSPLFTSKHTLSVIIFPLRVADPYLSCEVVSYPDTPTVAVEDKVEL
jgi:hypothetical protein